MHPKIKSRNSSLKGTELFIYIWREYVYGVIFNETTNIKIYKKYTE